MWASARDPFTALNRILEQHTGTGAVRKACWAVEDCIINNRDNLRGFFDKCFPNLLKRIFGYDDFEASWLNIVTKSGREEDARALVNLLSPTGRLMSAMFSADADHLIKYIFPVERLPAHTQELMKTHAGRCELERWPQYHGRLVPNAVGNPQAYLSVFEYFMFWTAFYVLRGARSMRDGASAMGGRGAGSSGFGLLGWPVPDQLMSDIVRMGSTLFTGHFHSAHGTPLHTHPYYTLLRAYLRHLIPRAASMGGPSMLEGSLKAEQAYGSPLSQLVLSILIEFWLTDAAEPVPLDSLDLHQAAGPTATPKPTTSPAAPTTAAGAHTDHSSGLSSTLAGLSGVTVPTALRVLSYQPPPEELVEALTQLFRYIHIIDIPSQRGPSRIPPQPTTQPAQSSEPWLPEVPVRTLTPMTASTGTSTRVPPPSAHALPMASAVSLLGSPSASPAVQASSRKLYRFLRRTFAQWPLSSSASLTPVVSLFLTILTPWAAPSAATAPTTTSPALARAIPNYLRHASEGISGHSSSQGGQRRHLPVPVNNPLAAGLHQGSPSSSSAQPSQYTYTYTPQWQAHVLLHLPFYCVLIPQFLALAFARLSLQADTAAAELLLLLRALQASGPQLMQELRSAERTYNGYLAAHKRRPEGPLADLLPWVAEQTLGFEAAAVAGAQPTMPMQMDTTFRLFSTDTSGAPHYGSAILRAAQAQVRPELREALADAMFAVLPITDVSADIQPPPEPPQLSAALRAYPRAGHWAELRYKGDWLTRPIASHEIAPLVRVLVWVSRWLNHVLRLDVPWRGDDAEEEAETVVQEGLRWLRRRGYRVSLRFLAEVQTLGWILAACLLLAAFMSGSSSTSPAPHVSARPQLHTLRHQ